MKFLYGITQRIFWIPSRLFLFSYKKIVILDPQGARRKARPPLIIAANHKSSLDPFLIGSSFPASSPIFPLRFMAEYKSFKTSGLEFLRKTGLVFLLYKLLGCFPSRRGEGLEKATELPLKFLRDNQTVLMFPEGERVFGENLGTFRNGTACLALKSGAPILPVALKPRPSASENAVFIKFGEVFRFDKNLPYGEATEILKRKIFELYTAI